MLLNAQVTLEADEMVSKAEKQYHYANTTTVEDYINKNVAEYNPDVKEAGGYNSIGENTGNGKVPPDVAHRKFSSTGSDGA